MKRDHKASEPDWRAGVGKPQVTYQKRQGWSLKATTVLKCIALGVAVLVLVAVVGG